MSKKPLNIAQAYATVEQIARRTEKLNPTKPSCMDNVFSCLRAYEIECAISFIFQGVLNDDDHLLLDISLHDLMYLLSVISKLPSDNRKLGLGDFAVMLPYVLKKFEAE